MILPKQYTKRRISEIRRIEIDSLLRRDEKEYVGRVVVECLGKPELFLGQILVVVVVVVVYNSTFRLREMM